MSTCKDCKFWTPLYQAPEEVGYVPHLCRRYAPQNNKGCYNWPETIETDWCGEFQQREKDEQSTDTKE